MIKSCRQRLLAAGFVALIGSLAAPAEADEAKQRSGTEVGRTVRPAAATKTGPGTEAISKSMSKSAAATGPGDVMEEYKVTYDGKPAGPPAATKLKESGPGVSPAAPGVPTPKR